MWLGATVGAVGAKGMMTVGAGAMGAAGVVELVSTQRNLVNIVEIFRNPTFPYTAVPSTYVLPVYYLV